MLRTTVFLALLGLCSFAAADDSTQSEQQGLPSCPPLNTCRWQLRHRLALLPGPAAVSESQGGRLEPAGPPPRPSQQPLSLPGVSRRRSSRLRTLLTPQPLPAAPCLQPMPACSPTPTPSTSAMCSTASPPTPRPAPTPTPPPPTACPRYEGSPAAARSDMPACLLRRCPAPCPGQLQRLSTLCLTPPRLPHACPTLALLSRPAPPPLPSISAARLSAAPAFSPLMACRHHLPPTPPLPPCPAGVCD